MITVSHLHKRYGGIHALDDCSLDIAPGKITAIIGPNGSGKTTLFDAITRLIPLDSGSIHFGKENITQKPTFTVAKLGISRTFQQVRLFKNLTIRQHLEIALSSDDESICVSVIKDVQSLFSPKKLLPHEKRIKEVLALVGLDKPLETYASDLSYGQKKLLDLAIAIIKPHAVLMLDEPVAGVNPKLRLEIVQIIHSLHRSGETIVIIEHDMNFVMNLAQHIFVMESGRVIAGGNPEDIQKNKSVLEAYLGK